MDILTPAAILSGMMMAFGMTPHQAFDVRTDPVVCMAAAIYYEARNQSYQGRVAVGNLVLSSTAHDAFADTVCKVVETRLSYINERALHLKQAEDLTAWQESVRITGLILNGQIGDNTDGALFYCNPRTATRKWCKMASGRYIGDHKFVSYNAYVKAVTPKSVKVNSK